MILDGLRGVAAIMVLVFHIFETYTIGTENAREPIIGHGYLAVDFFFVLSGFVIGYAYDDRWTKMSLGSFLKRRLIRLHPMVIFGMALGAVLFYFGASTEFPLIAGTPVWKMLLFMLLGMFLIPVPPSADIRGWQEMLTLDAPCWTLFFEYIANLLYAFFIRKFSTITLTLLVILSACATIYLTLSQGDVSGGWTLDVHHMHVGFTRLMFPFFAGLLLFRLGRLIRIRKAFFRCSILLIILLAMPRIGGDELWKNGIYEASIILLAFPLLVLMGAGGEIKGRFAAKCCKLLGDLSYPVYLVNYPLIYIFTGWIKDTGYTFAQSWPQALAVFVGTILISYVAFKFYDEPIRRKIQLRIKRG